MQPRTEIPATRLRCGRSCDLVQHKISRFPCFCCTACVKNGGRKRALGDDGVTRTFVLMESRALRGRCRDWSCWRRRRATRLLDRVAVERETLLLETWLCCAIRDMGKSANGRLALHEGLLFCCFGGFGGRLPPDCLMLVVGLGTRLGWRGCVMDGLMWAVLRAGFCVRCTMASESYWDGVESPGQHLCPEGLVEVRDLAWILC
jgi:hypothetical protein